MMKSKMKQTKAVNWPITILLILGSLTIFFPLYMAIVIAFKQPSEMTNDIMGALALPSSFSFHNFAEAMRVTDFWNSLVNSLIISGAAVILSVLIHSLAGYAIGRSMKDSKFYKFVYLYIVSGMFVPFAILMMPLVKQTSEMGIGHSLCGILYADELTFVQRLSEEHTDCTGRGGESGWSIYLENILEHYLSDYETNACNRCGIDGTWHLE